MDGEVGSLVGRVWVVLILFRLELVAIEMLVKLSGTRWMVIIIFGPLRISSNKPLVVGGKPRYSVYLSADRYIIYIPARCFLCRHRAELMHHSEGVVPLKNRLPSCNYVQEIVFVSASSFLNSRKQMKTDRGVPGMHKLTMNKKSVVVEGIHMEKSYTKTAPLLLVLFRTIWENLEYFPLPPVSAESSE